MRRRVFAMVFSAGVVALAAPAFPFMTRYGAFPHASAAPVTLLLAGVTTDYNDQAPVWPWPAKPEQFSFLTDTMLLAQFWPDGTVQVLSIPRDTWLDVPGYGWGKINAANRHGGSSMMVSAVQSLTDVKIDAYVLVSLYAIRALAQAAGGVTVDVAQDMKYDDNAGKLHIDLKAGRQHLNAAQIEGYLRFRKDAMGDIGRVARQQTFISAMTSRIKNPLNWWRLPGMVSAVDRNMKSNLSRAQVSAVLASVLHRPKVSMHTLPGTFGEGGTWAVNHADLSTLVNSSFTDPNDPHRLKIAIINVNAPPGSAGRLKDKLESLGYQQVSVGNGAGADTTTTIAGSQVKRVLQDVGYGEMVPRPSEPGADVTVRLGSDTPTPTN